MRARVAPPILPHGANYAYVTERTSATLARMSAQQDATGSRMLQIGEVAERLGLSLRTIRYYEEMGLVEPETRTEGGFRLYTEDHVERLALIRRMKPLGFSVQEMRNLLDARDAVRSNAGDAASRERLASFATDARERFDVLAARLERARELVVQLQRESRAA
jgi:DNA-binding transcriptional MerR regulator